MKAIYRVADVLNKHQLSIENISCSTWKSRTLHALRKCRTAALGGHIDQCNCCNKIHLSYNSCRNRHCPNCQGHKREQWINKRTSELLNTPYFHVVFTLPSELNPLALKDPKLVYSTLFKAAWETLNGFGKNPQFLGAKMGMIALLHTWGQNLSLHPHLHCIVPAGGVNNNRKWKHLKKKDKFLFPVKSMSSVFRAKFVKILRKESQQDKVLYDKLFSKQWVVYAKRPFKNTYSVIEYLGRYSHKVAISNHRILKIDNTTDTLSFCMKNYKKNGKKQVLTLKQKEFIRRFSLHILPKRFVRIRHYGILSGTWKSNHLAELQKQLKTNQKNIAVKPIKLGKCPYCKKGTLVTIFVFTKERPPPLSFLKQLKNRKLHPTF